MRNTLILFFFIISNCSIDAQDDGINTNGFSVGIVPSALLNVWTGFQGKVEYGFMDNLAVDLNIGYIRGRENDGPYSGVRIRPSIKYYFNEDYNENDRFYVSIGYLFRDHNTRSKGSISRAGGQFFERVNYTRATRLTGVFAMFGARSRLTKRIWIDGGIGLGPGLLDIKNEDLEPGAVLVNDSERLFTFTIREPGTRRLGIIIAHFSICFGF